MVFGIPDGAVALRVFVIFDLEVDDTRSTTTKIPRSDRPESTYTKDREEVSCHAAAIGESLAPFLGDDIYRTVFRDPPPSQASHQ